MRGELLDQVISEARFTFERIAADSGITSAALRRYRHGSRTPSYEYVTLDLPEALIAHASRLQVLAKKLRATPTKEDADE